MSSCNVDLSSLTKADLSRLVAVVVHGNVTNIDYQSAANAYGSSSVNGFKVCWAETRKKCQKLFASNGAAGETEIPTASVKTMPRKRKSKDEGDSNSSPKKSKGVDGQAKAKQTKNDGVSVRGSNVKVEDEADTGLDVADDTRGTASMNMNSGNHNVVVGGTALNVGTNDNGNKEAAEPSIKDEDFASGEE